MRALASFFIGHVNVSEQVGIDCGVLCISSEIFALTLIDIFFWSGAGVHDLDMAIHVSEISSRVAITYILIDDHAHGSPTELELLISIN